MTEAATLSTEEQVIAIEGILGVQKSNKTCPKPAQAVEILDEELYEADEPINFDLIPEEFRSLQ